MSWNHDKNALLQAVILDRSPWVQRLIRQGADLESRDSLGRTPLMLAARHGCTRNVQVLLKAGVALNATDSLGCSPLLHAAGYGSVDTLQNLLDAGARVDQADNQGCTALMLAAGRHDPQDAERLVAMLLAHEARVDLTNADGSTALHWSADQGNVAASRHLLAAGADPMVRDHNKGRTAIERARFFRHETLAQELEAHQVRQALVLPERESETMSEGPRL